MKQSTMHYDEIIKNAADFVRSFMREHGNLNLLYHKLTHTENVVTAVTEIASHHELNEKEHFICLIAAWFHDIGYYEDVLNHEQVSAQKAETFLISHGVDEDTTDAIKHCILATKVPQNPNSLLEEIVCDADLYHFGTDNFPVQNKLLRKETEAIHHIRIDKNEWRNCTIRLLENHHYYTDYCKHLLNKKKKENLERLKKKKDKQEMTVNPMDKLLQEHMPTTSAYEEKETNVPEQPERGTETLFRIASGVSQRLNEQADTKAHILISVNAILISVFLTLVIRRAEHDNYPTIPIIMFLTVNLITIIFSILATRPSVPDAASHQTDEENWKTNLLFFGNFYQMNFDDYAKKMLQVIGDKHYLYLSLIRNLYDQGIVLGKKYRLLKIAYNVFMFGIVVSVIAYVFASRYWNPLE